MRQGANRALRVLLVSAQEALYEELEQTLSSQSGGHQLHWVAQPDLAGGRATEVLPDIILVDGDLGSKAIVRIRDLLVLAPGATIVYLAGEGPEAMNEASRAVMAGARGFLTKPLSGEQLVANLRDILRQGSQTAARADRGDASGQVIAFCGAKGGTGRTTLAVNSALALHALTGESVALMDADYAAPAIDVALNLPSQRDISDLLSRVALLDQELVSRVMIPHASGVQVLRAPSPGELHEPITLPKVQEIVVLLKQMFSWVLVDLGALPDETLYAFLDTTNHIILSVVPELVAMRNARFILEQFHAHGHPEDKIWVVVNRATMPGGIPKGDMEKRLRVPIKSWIPDDPSLVAHSINRGVPVMMSQRRGVLVKAYRDLAQELVEELAGRDGVVQNASAGALTRRIQSDEDDAGAKRRRFILRTAGQGRRLV